MLGEIEIFFNIFPRSIKRFDPKTLTLHDTSNEIY